MHFYTADSHFGHESIMRHCNRPFRSVEEMDYHMLSNYQSAVKHGDDLWLLGDFAFAHIDDAERLRALLRAIPGRKHLVKGNHDKLWVSTLPEWHSVHDLVEVKDAGTRVTLCHYPLLTWAGARWGALNLFGHVHRNWAGSRNSVNVGVDMWGFQPVTLPEIQQRAQGLPVNPFWSVVEPGIEI